ncbi:DUF5309 family protein [Campylobacter sp. RM16188]|uniref:SU10 major capsid protein n=1 Tax=Campylobacter sp. RM16188 TaxID=1705725 RepID=UPI001555328D|nr:DUF5309 family protein [Campylobacter sp. RM16188]
MPTLKEGLIASEEAFGKSGVDLENTIKQIGWRSTPFLSSIGTAAPADRSSNVALGHQWHYDELPDGELANAHAEGGAKSALKYSIGGTLKNHFQIVKNAYGITGSEQPSRRVDGKAVLANEGEHASVRHKKSIEKILLSDQAAVQRVKSSSTVGKCGGLKSFVTSVNTVDAKNAALSMQLIRDLLKIGYMKDRPYDFLIMADTQQDRLMDILDKIKQADMKVDYLNDKIQVINSQYGNNVKILLSPELANNEIIAYRSEDILKVNWRPMEVRELPTSDDAIEKEIISEFTLRVCTPVAFAWLKNLKAD